MSNHKYIVHLLHYLGEGGQVWTMLGSVDDSRIILTFDQVYISYCLGDHEVLGSDGSDGISWNKLVFAASQAS